MNRIPILWIQFSTVDAYQWWRNCMNCLILLKSPCLSQKEVTVHSDILLDQFLRSGDANAKIHFFPVKPTLRQYCRTNLSLHKGYFLSGAFPFLLKGIVD